jgi:hypothetical protein
LSTIQPLEFALKVITASEVPVFLMNAQGGLTIFILGRPRELLVMTALKVLIVRTLVRQTMRITCVLKAIIVIRIELIRERLKSAQAELTMIRRELLTGLLVRLAQKVIDALRVQCNQLYAQMVRLALSIQQLRRRALLEPTAHSYRRALLLFQRASTIQAEVKTSIFLVLMEPIVRQARAARPPALLLTLVPAD